MLDDAGPATDARRLRDLEPDERRILDLGTRSRALLDLSANSIARTERRPPPMLDDLERTAKYQLFHRSLATVRLMASGHTVYDGSTRMGPVTRTNDPRLTAVAEVAEVASVTAAQLDTHTRSRARSEDRGLELCEEFMATLPSPRRHDRPAPVDRRSRTRSDRARDWAAVFDDVAADAWAVIAAMPDQCNGEERIKWEDALLADTDFTSDVGEIIPAPVPDPAILKAAAEVCQRLYAQRGKAERTKAQRLEQARARVRRSDDEGVILAARDRDLHAELVEPLTAEVNHVERMVVRSAFRVAPRMSTWPGRGHERVPRALKLAATMTADEADMVQAFATIGYAKIG